jgi:hypothetical protein
MFVLRSRRKSRKSVGSSSPVGLDQAKPSGVGDTAATGNVKPLRTYLLLLRRRA